MAEGPGASLYRTGVLGYLRRKGIIVQDTLSGERLRIAGLKTEPLCGMKSANITCKGLSREE